MPKTLTVALVTIISLVIAWHIGFFLLGGAIAVTATIWSFIVASIVVFCIAILLAFILTGIGVFVLAILALIWTVLATLLFPILFPILVPLFIILLFVAYLRRREQRKQVNATDTVEKL